jgi:acyl-CoA reductase-like NAD-dependent aldehyde dehydrogenase
MAEAAKKEQADILRTISPVDGSVLVERPLQTAADVDAVLARAKAAQKSWRLVPMGEKQALMLKFMNALIAKADEIGVELTKQMGRPVRYTSGEVTGAMVERIKYMVDMAPKALADIIPPDVKDGFKRFIRREPVGVVAIIAPWNYPYLTSVNTIVPALLAGNTVVLKHSAQTPLCADRFAAAF